MIIHRTEILNSVRFITFWGTTLCFPNIESRLYNPAFRIPKNLLYISFWLVTQGWGEHVPLTSICSSMTCADQPQS